ncbi:hypothetical protein J4458_03465 [Candidatus Woesearchaeota archaeon]|nr:hypothetical protein [Candidatus Woesearchaeota archaeon]
MKTIYAPTGMLKIPDTLLKKVEGAAGVIDNIHGEYPDTIIFINLPGRAFMPWENGAGGGSDYRVRVTPATSFDREYPKITRRLKANSHPDVVADVGWCSPEADGWESIIDAENLRTLPHGSFVEDFVEKIAESTLRLTPTDYGRIHDSHWPILASMLYKEAKTKLKNASEGLAEYYQTIMKPARLVSQGQSPKQLVEILTSRP